MKSRSLKIANHADFDLKKVLEKVKAPAGLIVGPSTMIVWMTQEFSEKFTVADNVFLTDKRISSNWGRSLLKQKIIIDPKNGYEFKVVDSEVGDGNFRVLIAKHKSEDKYSEQIKKAVAFRRIIEICIKTP